MKNDKIPTQTHNHSHEKKEYHLKNVAGFIHTMELAWNIQIIFKEQIVQ